MQALNELNYEARWEAHADAPQVVLGHCPYAEIIDAHPELCQMDTFLLEILIGERAEQVEKLALNVRGWPYCLFRVG